MQVTKAACPNCLAILKSFHRVPEGKTVKCPKCGVPFIPDVQERHRFEAKGRSNSSSLSQVVPLSTGEKDKKRIQVNRLVPVLVGFFLFLGVGASLATFCFSKNKKAVKDLPPTEPVANAFNPPQPSSEIPLVTLPLEQQLKVNQAVNRGIRYLKTSQSPDGTWANSYAVGFAALPGLVLLECGLPTRDPTVQKAAEFVRNNSAQLGKTYELALAILFLDLLGESRDHELIQTLALRLVAGQDPSGSWNYDCPVLNQEENKQLALILKNMGTQPLSEFRKLHPTEALNLPLVLKNRMGMGVLQGEPGDEIYKNWSGDNSNTQFAILGLWAARRHDVPLDRSMALVVRHFRTTQNPDGSWNYSQNNGMAANPPRPTMTCAGLLGLAIGHGLSRETQAQDERLDKDPAIDKAFQVVTLALGQPTAGEAPSRPKVAMDNLYFMWSVERVAVIFNRKTINDKDWYAWGSQILLENQDDKGYWSESSFPGSSPPLNTCFGLLFLKQANLAKDLTNKLELLAGGKKQ